MEWRDEAIVLAARPHGENGAILSLLTREHGRHCGLMRGARSRRQAGLCEPGNTVQAIWRARLADHLGQLTCEVTRFHAAQVMDDPDRLAGLAAACALLDAVLPERLPCPDVFETISRLLDRLTSPPIRGDIPLGWAADMVCWEATLLAELGFGLDLSVCAATGSRDDLVWVSPRSGRAVSATAGAPHADRLLSLPAFLTDTSGNRTFNAADIVDGLALTGFFLVRRVLAEATASGSAVARLPGAVRTLPPARLRLADRLAEQVRERHAKERGARYKSTGASRESTGVPA